MHTITTTTKFSFSKSTEANEMYTCVLEDLDNAIEYIDVDLLPNLQDRKITFLLNIIQEQIEILDSEQKELIEKGGQIIIYESQFGSDWVTSDELQEVNQKLISLYEVRKAIITILGLKFSY